MKKLSSTTSVKVIPHSTSSRDICNGLQVLILFKAQTAHSKPSQSKKLKPVPPNAPRDIKKCGIFTFRHGVRIIDYRLPTRKPTITPHSSQELRGCDGFDSPEAE